MIAKSRLARWFLLALGWVSLTLGIIGIPLPVVPTVPFILLAAFAFSRSSERFDTWLTEHHLFGPMVLDWRAGLGMPARSKVYAIVSIALAFSVTIFLVLDSAWPRIGMGALGVAMAVYILTRPTKQVPETVS